MEQVVSTGTPSRYSWWSRTFSLARAEAPTLSEWSASLATAVLLILSFPDFGIAVLAWVCLVPLLFTVAQRPSPMRAFFLGWATGFVAFYGTCYWLTYSMIHYGGLPGWLAYLLLVPGGLVIGTFPGFFAFILAVAVKRFGPYAVVLAVFIWPATEWARLGVTGQLWNAIGYTQTDFLLGAFIRPARWGGVYAAGALVVGINAAIALAVLRRKVVTPLALLVLIAAVVIVSFDGSMSNERSGAPFFLYVVAVQPNVPMNVVKSATEINQLIAHHLTMSREGLGQLPNDNVPRLVVWPESPMNFTYANDQSFRELVAKFTTENHTSLLFNSLEPAPGDGAYNSALLINEEGRLIAQYDKIRLMPFGEYVPLPRWLPGASLITGLVGEFTPGDKYTLMPIAGHKVGVFICIESAYPWIARRLTSEGAEVLINISNDGYLGRTAVMRQHLDNAIVRAVENGRPVLRVTNTGLSAEIRADGFVQEQTMGFQPDVRTWKVGPSLTSDTFYTKHGDLFVQLCAAITTVVIILSLVGRRRSFRDSR
jgi:apolipoprotein N-acyltransferase